MSERSPTPPTALGRKYVRYVVGFGVGVAVGMAPFLGLLDVPLFAPLLSMFPESVRGTAIPLSAFLMGLVAVGIQFASGEEVSRRWLRWSFATTFVALVVGLVVLLNLYSGNVLTVPNVEAADGRTIDVRLVVGGERPVLPLPGCECSPTQGDVACIQEIGFENAAACWGRRQVTRAEKSLTLAYLFLTGGFGALIGLLLLQEGSRRKRPKTGGR
ncbi:MAG TPA: hypothetical protein VLF66_12750 [Thermoanaerobaculia bacterium]|nr:hypothetical protein [Thermoanaerobaculia bacterium]